MARNKLAGQPRPDWVKAKISASQQARYERNRGPLPERKPCSLCRKVKPASEFGTTTRRLVSGAEVLHLRSWCKPCTNERNRAYRAQLAAEGKLDEKKRQWNKAAREAKRRGKIEPKLPLEPLVGWIESSLSREWVLGQLTPEGLDYILRRRGKQKMLTLDVIDRVLLALDRQEMLWVLYPPTGQSR